MSISSGSFDLESVCSKMKSDSEADWFDSTVRIRKWISDEALGAERVPVILEAGLVPRLVEFMKRDGNCVLQFEAAWALTNLASGTAEETRVVVDQGVVPVFCRLLNTKHAELQEQVIWGLGNISGDSLELRNIVVESGAIGAFDLILQSESFRWKNKGVGTTAWAFCNLARFKPPLATELALKMVPTLALLVHNKDDEVTQEAMTALAFLCPPDVDQLTVRVEYILRHGMCRRVLALGVRPNRSMLVACLKLIVAFLSCSELATKCAMRSGAAAVLAEVLCRPGLVHRDVALIMKAVEVGSRGGCEYGRAALVHGGVVEAIQCALAKGTLEDEEAVTMLKLIMLNEESSEATSTATAATPTISVATAPAAEVAEGVVSSSADPSTTVEAATDAVTGTRLSRVEIEDLSMLAGEAALLLDIDSAVRNTRGGGVARCRAKDPMNCERQPTLLPWLVERTAAAVPVEDVYLLWSGLLDRLFRCRGACAVTCRDNMDALSPFVSGDPPSPDADGGRAAHLRTLFTAMMAECESVNAAVRAALARGAQEDEAAPPPSSS